MGRKSIKKSGPMSAAERQRRRRKRLRRERSAELNKIPARKHADEQLKRYVPTPPGVTYWVEVEVVTPKGPVKVWACQGPRPLGTIANKNDDSVLTDDEIIGMLRDLKRIAVKRGLAVDWDTLEARFAEIEDTSTPQDFKEAAE